MTNARNKIQLSAKRERQLRHLSVKLANILFGQDPRKPAFCLRLIYSDLGRRPIDLHIGDTVAIIFHELRRAELTRLRKAGK